MAVSVVMPALEMAQETGKLLAWLKKEGDSVKKGEPLVEIETDKVTVEVEAPADGILAALKAWEGAEIPVGHIIAWIVAPGEQPPAESPSAAPAARAMTEQSVRPASVASAAGVAGPAEPSARVSPKAKRVAKELGVDLSRVRGTGPDGTITSEDVEAAAKSQGPAEAAEPAALSSVARLMAQRTTESWTTTPHFFLVREIDATPLLVARQHHGAGMNVKLTHTDLLVALVARVVAKHPKLNASWTGRTIHFHSDVNISLAAAVKDGVVGVVIPKANTATLAEIAGQRSELSERARAGRLRPPDVTGGTFTISNLGMYQVDAFSAIITPPQAAVLAVGAITDRVVAVRGQPAVRPMMTLTLSSDHRVVDGAQAAVFLKDLVDALGEPGKWLI